MFHSKGGILEVYRPHNFFVKSGHAVVNYAAAMTVGVSERENVRKGGTSGKIFYCKNNIDF